MLTDVIKGTVLHPHSNLKSTCPKDSFLMILLTPFAVAVPLGKTKSIVDRFEKRESSSIDCSPPTGSRGDRTVRVDSPPTSSVCTHVFLMWLTSRFL
jgi:hypothetical protein